MRYFPLNAALALTVTLWAVPAAAKSLNTAPSSVTNQLKSDSEAKTTYLGTNYFEAIDTYQEALKKKTGLDIAADYNALWMSASHSLGKRSSSGGVARIYGEWKLFHPESANAGSLIFKIEHRHAYGDVAPLDFGFETGYVGLYHSTFNNQHFRTTNLYWKQKFLDGNAMAYAGFLDVTDYVDVYLLASPWTSFNNLVFATGSGTIGGLPDGALGAMAGGWINDELYLCAGMVDANAKATEIGEGFKSLFDEFETFKSIEIGWSPSHASLLFSNMHLTFWQIDARQKAGTPEGWGVSFSAVNTFDKSWMGFLRGGYSDGGGALLERSVSTGFAYLPNENGDVLGVGINWGRPNHEDYGEGLRDQWTAELYYAWQISKHIQITPSIQNIYHPALYTNTDNILLGVVRLRIDF